MRDPGTRDTKCEHSKADHSNCLVFFAPCARMTETLHLLRLKPYGITQWWKHKSFNLEELLSELFLFSPKFLHYALCNNPFIFFYYIFNERYSMLLLINFKDSKLLYFAIRTSNRVIFFLHNFNVICRLFPYLFSKVAVFNIIWIDRSMIKIIAKISKGSMCNY